MFLLCFVAVVAGVVVDISIGVVGIVGIFVVFASRGVCVRCAVGAAPLYGKWGKGYDSMADKKAAMEAEAKIKEAKKQAYNERVK